MRYNGLRTKFKKYLRSARREKAMNKKEKQKRIGEIGESVVRKYLGGTLSSDPFDQVKDLVLEDGTEVEVKTQARWRAKDVFTIYETPTGNNLRKCLEVDRLIFVEPSLSGTFRLFECTDRTYSVLYPGGSKAYAFPVSSMTLIDEVAEGDLWQEFVDLTRTSLRFLV